MSIFKSRAPAMSPPPAINVTPLINVLLVLLIIFMVIQLAKGAGVVTIGLVQDEG